MPDTIPVFQRAVLTRDFPDEDLLAGAELIVVDHIDQADGGEAGYVVEVGPWSEQGAPRDVQHVPRSAVMSLAPCEDLFDLLARRNGGLLLEVVEGGRLAPEDLTFAAEYLGRTTEPGTVPALLRLLSSDHAVVREGAVLGLRRHKTAEVGFRLEAVRDSDPSESVREVAKDVLDLWADE